MKSLRCTPLLLAALAAARVALPAVAGQVDETDGLEWSNRAANNTPEFDRQFRGDFNNDLVTATLDNLRPHEMLQISFQLFILRSWDGMGRTKGNSRIGPDYIRVGLEDGRTLLHASFSNTPVLQGFDDQCNWQGYPSPVPGDKCPFMTGADLKNVLGYFYAGDPHPAQPTRMDAIYTLRMLVPHTANKVVMHFHGMGLQNKGDESWGVADLKIVPLAKSATQVPVADMPSATYELLDGRKMIVPHPDASTIGTMLQPASGREPIAAQAAFWRLVAGGDATAALLPKVVKPVPIDTAKVKLLVAAVYDKTAPRDERDTRIREIVALGSTIEPVLRDLRDEAKETPSRLDWALMDLGLLAIDEPEQRQWIVATRILDAIATPAAKQARTALIATPKPTP